MEALMGQSRPSTPPQRQTSGSLRKMHTDIPNFDNGGLWSSQSDPGSQLNIQFSPLAAATDSSLNTGSKRVKWDSSNFTKEYSPEFMDERRERPIPVAMKPILKPSTVNVSSPAANVSTLCASESSTMMIRSILYGLVQLTVSSRVDAYRTFSRVLQAYGTDGIHISDKQADTILRQVERDVLSKSPNFLQSEHELEFEALNTLSAFIRSPKLSTYCKESLLSTVLESAIKGFQPKSKISKTIAIKYLDILTCMNLPNKVATAERVVRIVEGLGSLDSIVTGKRVLQYRLLIFERLIKHSEQAMARTVKSWVKHLYAGLLNDTEQIRTQAISFGLSAALSFGHISSVASVILSFLDAQTTNNSSYLRIFVQKLNELRTDKSVCQQVPRMWSVVTLFLRNKDFQFNENWSHFNIWKSVIQSCFNSRHIELKREAHAAWNRLIFATELSERTPPSIRRLLVQPFSQQLEQSSSNKMTEAATRCTRSSLCCLLFYALRPGCSFGQTDLYWDEYISPIIPKLLLRDMADHRFAISILRKLISNQRNQHWNSNRANDESVPVKVEELTGIDPKWTRSRSGKVLDILLVAFQKDSFSLPTEDEFNIRGLWLDLMSSIQEASAKEIVLSSDLKASVVNILRFLKKAWQEFVSGMDKSHARLARLETFYITMSSLVSQLGTICLTEMFQFPAFLKVSHAADIETEDQPQIQRPITFIFELFATIYCETAMSSLFYDEICLTLDRCCSARSSLEFKCGILRECIRTLGPTDTEQQQKHQQHMWKAVADVAIQFLNAYLQGGLESDRAGEFACHDEIMEILQWPLKNDEICHLSVWFRLYDIMFTITGRSPDHCVPKAQKLGQEFAESIHQSSSRVQLQVALSLLEKAALLILDGQSKKGLKKNNEVGIGLSVTDVITFKHNIFSGAITDDLIFKAHEELNNSTVKLTAELLESLVNILSKVNTDEAESVVKSFETSFSQWIRYPPIEIDGKRVTDLTNIVQRLWNLLINDIWTVESWYEGRLIFIKNLLLAGLYSEDLIISDTSVAFLDNVFEMVDFVQCPVQIFDAFNKKLKETKLSSGSHEANSDIYNSPTVSLKMDADSKAFFNTEVSRQRSSDSGSSISESSQYGTPHSGQRTQRRLFSNVTPRSVPETPEAVDDGACWLLSDSSPRSSEQSSQVTPTPKRSAFIDQNKADVSDKATPDSTIFLSCEIASEATDNQIFTDLPEHSDALTMPSSPPPESSPNFRAEKNSPSSEDGMKERDNQDADDTTSKPSRMADDDTIRHEQPLSPTERVTGNGHDSDVLSSSPPISPLVMKSLSQQILKKRTLESEQQEDEPRLKRVRSSSVVSASHKTSSQAAINKPNQTATHSRGKTSSQRSSSFSHSQSSSQRSQRAKPTYNQIKDKLDIALRDLADVKITKRQREEVDVLLEQIERLAHFQMIPE